MGKRERAADRAGRPVMRSPGRPPVGRLEHRQRFWAAIARGASSVDAAVEAGVSAAVGVRWFREAGGMPSVTLARASGRYLSFVEREEIAILRARGDGVGEIARQLGRSPSTISRELRRNAATRGGGLDYRVSPELRRYVQDRLSGAVQRPDGTAVEGSEARWNGRRHGR
ncbi:MAG: helix-turn-helix domain-containing protein, partial [Actinomycetota bacterium]|nr:helix-turn-helix domain-containing protein [Actinomycetota bacterium]